MLKRHMSKTFTVYMRKELINLLEQMEKETGLNKSKLISFAVLNLYLIFKENYHILSTIVKMWETILEKLPEKILTIQGKE